MSERSLTPTSFVVLGLLEVLGPTTPYELKRYGQGGLFLFWSIPHTQIYSECERLSASGHLVEQREETGRRRRVFGLTSKGRRALGDWRGDPQISVLEVRDEGLLKLYFGAERESLSHEQAVLHRQRAEFIQSVHEGRDLPAGVQAVFETAVTLERTYARLWEKLAAGASKGG